MSPKGKSFETSLNFWCIIFTGLILLYKLIYL